MSNYSIQTLKSSDINSLLTLQEENLINNISGDTAQNQGFLTFQFNNEFIQGLMQDMQQPVAMDNEKLIGYALAASQEQVKPHPLFKPLIDYCKQNTYNNTPIHQIPYYIMGQICVKEGYRNLGIFDALYQKHKELYSEKYQLLITEISVDNRRSLAAHQRVGFKVIGQYSDGVTLWNVVVWDFKN